MRLSKARATARSLRSRSNSSSQRDGVADADECLGLFAAAHADVNEQVVDLGRLGVLVVLHQVRRDVADDALDRAVGGVDDDALGLGDGGIHAAHFADVNVALVVNVVDRHGDFVGVAGEHQARGAALVQHGHAIAVGVGESFVGKAFGVIEPDALAAGLVADRAGGVDQCP